VRVRQVVQAEDGIHAGPHAHQVLALVHRAFGKGQAERRHRGDLVFGDQMATRSPGATPSP